MTWELSSRVVVAGLIQGVDTVNRQRHLLGIRPEILSPKWREIYRRSEGVTPSVETLAKTEGELAALEPLMDLRLNVTDIDQAAQECAEYYQIDGLKRALRNAETAIEKGEKPSLIRTTLVQEVSNTRAASGQKNDAASILHRMRTTATVPSTVKTNIAWLDSVTKGGARVGQLWVIGAPEKSRKTSFVRNVVMNVLRDKGIPGGKAAVQFCALENDQIVTMADFVAMYAAEYIHYNGLAKKIHPVAKEPLAVFCDATTAEQYVADPNYIKHPDLRKAYDYAYRMCEGMVLEVLDRRADSGNLRTLEDIIEKKREFCAEHPGKHHIIVVDYAQIIKGKGTLFERIESFSDISLGLALEGEGATMIALSQFSREGKKEENTKQDIIFSKGGADLEQACHYYLTCEYKEDLEDYLFVELKRARRSGRKKVVFLIDKHSGLLLESGRFEGKNFISNGPILQSTTGLWS
jgi:replicative DNA helicase